MNIAKLNTVSLDDKTFIIKRGTGGGGSDTPTPSKPKYTGHADAEGLRAIGWTDEDIAYYQENGVNWNEEDDQYHLVTDDNKALYGVLTASNISTYKDRIVYLPKIDTSGIKSMHREFQACVSLIAIPMLDTSAVTDMDSMFANCYSLTSIPQLDTSNVTNMGSMFINCYALTSIPQLDTSNVKDMGYMFSYCLKLTSIPQLDTSNVTSMGSMFNECHSLTSIPQLDTSNVTNMGSMFNECHSLTSIPQLDTSNVTSMSQIFLRTASLVTINSVLDLPRVTNSLYFNYMTCLTNIKVKNLKVGLELATSPFLSKESILFIINNETATSAITIRLATYAYNRLATDADVVAALANHPNISISK